MRPNLTSASMTISKDPKYQTGSGSGLKKMSTFFVEEEGESRVEMGRGGGGEQKEKVEETRQQKVREVDEGITDQRRKQDTRQVESKERVEEDGLWDRLAERHKKIMDDIGYLEERLEQVSRTVGHTTRRRGS